MLVATAAQAFGGVDSLVNNSSDVFAPLGKGVLGSGLDKILIIAILSSASASTQTTILPTARTTLSMGRAGAIPKQFGTVNPRFLSPGFSTIWMGTVSMIVYIFLSVTSHDNLIADAFTSLSLTIAFYYGITGFACVIFYRKHLFDSIKNFVMIGVLPFVGGLILTWVLIKAVIDYSKPHSGYAKPFLGIGSPIAIALLTIILGLIAMLYMRITEPEFFKRNKPQIGRSLRARRRTRGAVVMSSGIIVGYDGSDGSKAALRTALDVAKAYNEKVTIAFGYGVNPMAGEVKDYAEALRELAHKRVEEAAGIAAAEDSQIDAVLVEKSAAQALTDLAEERDARLIVVGTHGESPIYGALIGSTPHKLLHISRRPVLVVPVPES